MYNSTQAKMRALLARIGVPVVGIESIPAFPQCGETYRVNLYLPIGAVRKRRRIRKIVDSFMKEASTKCLYFGDVWLKEEK